MSKQQNSLAYLVSSKDLERKINHPIKIVQYKDLYEYQSLGELMQNSSLSILIILINTSPNNTGHWTCLIRQNNLLTYFDSYGKKVDQELKYISNQNRIVLNETKPYLTNLIKQSGLKLIQNTNEYQSYAPNINTCGKYVTFVSNSIIKGMNLKEIQNLLAEIHHDRKESYDEIVNHFYNKYF